MVVWRPAGGVAESHRPNFQSSSRRRRGAFEADPTKHQSNSWRLTSVVEDDRRLDGEWSGSLALEELNILELHSVKEGSVEFITRLAGRGLAIHFSKLLLSSSE